MRICAAKSERRNAGNRECGAFFDGRGPRWNHGFKVFNVYFWIKLFEMKVSRSLSVLQDEYGFD
jgi:hypothetical protein